MAKTEVLIAGAGPTGLVLAIWLTRQGVKVRIVDRAAQPGTTSRALAVQARTLELYDQAGIAAPVVAAGQRVAAINLWVKGVRRARVLLESLGKGVSPFFFPLIFPQDQHEKLLIGVLSGLGVEVERPTEIVAFSDNGPSIRATLRKADGAEETVEALFLAGCDGASSMVRHAIGAEFPGGTYERLFYVADVQASGPAVNGELHVGLDTSDFLAVFPLQGDGRARLIGTVLEDRVRDKDLAFDDVGAEMLGAMKFTVDQVNWFSTYRVHHRVAGAWRKGRAFLCGDAAHIHSPAGGQGMNTGLGDAINLAWKLAAVVQGRAPEALLDSYQQERIGFARKLVATTDQVFTAATNPGALARMIRTRIVPLIMPQAVKLKAVRRLMFRIVSQTGITYRGSALSQGEAGAVQGGDRPPWVAEADNYRALDQKNWRVQVYGEASSELAAWCAKAGVARDVYPWSKGVARAGYRRDAAYLIRPDGYVGLAGATAETLTGYFASRNLKPA